MNEVRLCGARPAGIHDDHLRGLVRSAIAAGWEVTRTRGGHLRFRSPSGPCVIAAGTPSGRRGVLNLRGDLRRHGLRI